ncbi:hypothetical protein ACQKOF_00155 [Lysinibacillus sp. NPDC093190]|uniref:hypothetical protein n=1 Tax=Lysinibacillus sp. NPDC093190 TaxID=3390575 RepID=UPI003D028448
MKNYIQYNAFQNKEVIIAIPALGERKEMYAALASTLPEARMTDLHRAGLSTKPIPDAIMPRHN